ncbi:hypothetical protein BCH308197_B0098 (plasmid) [Bacillus cereus H3081.97]|nr:hypothetical protein BCH308197_B0098 [Bacillus cereus H3081.97]
MCIPFVNQSPFILYSLFPLFSPVRFVYKLTQTTEATINQNGRTKINAFMQPSIKANGFSSIFITCSTTISPS